MILRYKTILAGMMLMSMTPVCHVRTVEARSDSLLNLGRDTTRSHRDRVLSYKDAIRLGQSGDAMYELANLYLTE